ncbi:Uncharacterised protein [Vibrio cholerae]|nr:Uncharacterised protein [Vibrio cholerae]
MIQMQTMLDAADNSGARSGVLRFWVALTVVTPTLATSSKLPLRKQFLAVK